MMSCQICGDTNGPFEYEEYRSKDKKPWLIENGQTVLVCEDCAKILKKRIKEETKKLNRCNKCSPIEKMAYICDDCERSYL